MRAPSNNRESQLLSKISFESTKQASEDTGSCFTLLASTCKSQNETKLRKGKSGAFQTLQGTKRWVTCEDRIGPLG